MDRKILQQWITTIQSEGIGLTKWEEDFVESVADQLETYGRLSERQQELIERIYVEKTR